MIQYMLLQVPIQNILDQEKTLNAETFTDYIQDMIQLGVTGPILFDGNGDRDGSYDIVLWRDGSLEYHLLLV